MNHRAVQSRNDSRFQKSIHAGGRVIAGALLDLAVFWNLPSLLMAIALIGMQRLPGDM
ncbi:MULTISPECIES: hypothetical protein [unclassified Leptolyngbya]|uniref:hypothetical protein n=1 Tax=unclassified Leptolyngbya TaxID=2650499 RepID=UPI0016852933|nr:MULTISPECIES: hypothetical protein [unclassified Leptolyngbya]MBD1913457.1 hypothetical protein [Leptolyngbya sp. FACHB-8]MBD2156320.1 hypothetical protein [Leptolyngbya sp. FACHB-16]